MQALITKSKICFDSGNIVFEVFKREGSHCLFSPSPFGIFGQNNATKKPHRHKELYDNSMSKTMLERVSAISSGLFVKCKMKFHFHFGKAAHIDFLS